MQLAEGDCVCTYILMNEVVCERWREWKSTNLELRFDDATQPGAFADPPVLASAFDKSIPEIDDATP